MYNTIRQALLVHNTIRNTATVYRTPETANSLAKAVDTLASGRLKKRFYAATFEKENIGGRDGPREKQEAWVNYRWHLYFL